MCFTCTTTALENFLAPGLEWEQDAASVALPVAQREAPLKLLLTLIKKFNFGRVASPLITE